MKVIRANKGELVNSLWLWVMNVGLKLKTQNLKLITHNLTLLFLTLFLSSCTLFQSAYDVADDYIDISWKKDKDKEQVVVDSVIIKFDFVYWKEETGDTNTVNIERDFDQNGYNIWILKTKGIRYNEVRKKDTVIYIYRNKK